MASTYTFKFDLNADTAALIYLAEIYHVDLLMLLLLYEKFGKDLFFFFFLFAGHQVSFPKSTKLVKILELSKGLSQLQAPQGCTQQEKQVFERIKKHFNKEDECLHLTMEVTHDRATEVDNTANGEGGFPDEPIHPPGTGNGEDIGGNGQSPPRGGVAEREVSDVHDPAKVV